MFADALIIPTTSALVFGFIPYVQVNCVEATLLLPVESVNVPAATLIVVIPGAEGVNVAV